VRWLLTRPGRVTRLALLNTLLYPELSDEVVEFVAELADPARRVHRTSDDGLAEVMRRGVVDPAVVDDEMMAAVLGPFPTPTSRDRRPWPPPGRRVDA
jgi:hypothetical protein